MGETTTSGYVSVNGLDVYYEVHGTGKPLVLLHGAFGSAQAWRTLLPTLAKTRQVYLLEQQGHGHTADRDRPLTYEQMAEDTAAALHELKLESPDIFGYSDGGTVALGVAIRHPGSIGKAAILGSCCRRLQEAYEPKEYAQYQEMPSDFAPPEIKEPYDTVAPEPSRWPILVQKIKELGRDFQGFTSEDMRSIPVPLLIMQGDRDVVLAEHAVEMFRLVPNAQLAIFPNMDHFLPWSNPDLLFSTLTAFLNTEESQ